MTRGAPETEQKDLESPKLEPQESGLLGWLRQTNEKFLLLKSLSILGVVGTVIGAVIGSYFQYKTAQQEQNLAHYKEDFAAATSAFTDVATALQSAMRLQHALFIAFSAAVRENIYADENAFLTKSGRDLYKGYVDERLTLRKNIDVLARRVEIYIDWASDLGRDPSTATPGLDPLSSSSVLGEYDFDCDKHMPRQNVSEIPLKDHPERPALRVDWNSAKHHVLSFFYCFERTHESIRAARQWASASEIDPQERAKLIPSPTDDMKKWQDDVDSLHVHIRHSLDNAVERQTAFNTLAMRRIEQIRSISASRCGPRFCGSTGPCCGASIPFAENIPPTSLAACSSRSAASRNDPTAGQRTWSVVALDRLPGSYRRCAEGRKTPRDAPEAGAANANFSKSIRKEGTVAGTTEHKDMTAEHRRLAEAERGAARWRRWGPYLSERQWGTVREDYSADGNAWSNFPYDQARSRAYRWGEDGIAGISDDQQRLCLALALWNERDPHLKERLFGLTGPEGNHGEDVKEYYYYLDATPSHAYLKMLYKYPQGEYPYAQLRNRNPSWDKLSPEFELIDTGLFHEDRYFDVFVEYAKASPEDIIMIVTAHNRGPDVARLHVLPTLWFRNTWSWKNGASPKPTITRMDDVSLEAKHVKLGTFRLYCDGGPELLFCENETNFGKLYGSNQSEGYFKDGINSFVVESDASAVNPLGVGSKAAPHYRADIHAGGSATFRVRLTNVDLPNPFYDADAILVRARQGADDYYADLQRDLPDPDARLVQRQALAGMIWTKQFYYYDVPEWLNGDPTQPAPPPERRRGRNSDWDHVNTADVLSMPDKWEYPWFAAWDLAFHCLPLALIDPAFAKEQLVLLTREWYSHPNGQLPAYEWNFGDVNPPVHAWATWRVFQIDRKQRGDRGDLRFLERVFHKLLLNFTWWVNRKDVEGRNIFQGGFLGLDNIGVFDRSRPLPTGGYINQADGTSWMAMYCLNMLRIALELARHNDVYEDIATKFFEHFLHIAEAMTDFQGCGTGLWDDEDKFYYDMLRTDDGAAYRMRLRSMVGLIPLFAVEVLEPELLEELPGFHRRLKWFLNYRPDLAALVSRWEEPGAGDRQLLSLLRGHRMKRLLARVLDESEFLSDYGVRALSKVHQGHPYRFGCGGEQHVVTYLPGESDSYMFGGNSNWRGPIWMPVNFLLIESMQRFHYYYGDDFKIECPTGSGRYATILEASEDLTRRLMRIFMRDGNGRRAVFGNVEKFQTDPHFRNYVLFYEYFHGDTGRGVGASHQTGWTGLIAKLMQPRKGV